MPEPTQEELHRYAEEFLKADHWAGGLIPETLEIDSNSRLSAKLLRLSDDRFKDLSISELAEKVYQNTGRDRWMTFIACRVLQEQKKAERGKP